MSVRSSGYGIDEDVLLCQVYLNISQDPVTCINQFWTRVEDAYNSARNGAWECRNKRSVQSRIQTIQKAIRKLDACIKQVENMHPSGASDTDIMYQAKAILTQDDNYKKGFKFDHVWNIVKDCEKFKNGVTVSRNRILSLTQNYVSSESDNPTFGSPLLVSPKMSSFSINSDDATGGSSSKGPNEVKTTKSKRKNDDQIAAVIDTLKEENRQLLEILKKTGLERQQQLELQSRSLALQETKEENKILMRDLNSISDLRIRAFIEAEQRRILEKRNKQHQQGQSSVSKTNLPKQ